jgi:uncharacterized protein (UPF0332 family)
MPAIGGGHALPESWEDAPDSGAVGRGGKGERSAMSENRDPDAYLRKAEESAAGALSELESERFNNCMNRAYYAVFQAAISALLRNGIWRGDRKWPHAFVQSEFIAKLINRRRSYPPRLRATLSDLLSLRHRADYSGSTISRAEANLAVRRCQEFVEAVRLESDRQ